MAFDLGTLNPDSAGKQIPMTPQGSAPRMVGGSQPKIAGPKAEQPTSVMGGNYFGPMVSGNSADNPLVVESSNGSRTSNVIGWAKAGLKKAFGIAGNPEPAPTPAAQPQPTAATIARTTPAAGDMTPVDHLGRPMALGQTISYSTRSVRKGSAGKIRPAATSAAPATIAGNQATAPAAVSGADAPQTPGYGIAGEPNLTQLSSDEFRSISPTGVKGYDPAAGGGVAEMDGKTVFLRGRTDAEQGRFAADQIQQASAPMIAGPGAGQQLTMVGSSSSEPRLVAPGQPAFGLDLKSASLLDALQANRRNRDAVREIEIAGKKSEIAERSDRTAMQAAELPSKIAGNLAGTRHANASTDIALAKAPVEIKGIEENNKHLAALTTTENQLRDLNAKGKIAEIDYHKGMLAIQNRRLDLLQKKEDARAAAAKSSGTIPDFRLQFDISKKKVDMYQQMATLGTLTPEQKLDLDKHVKNMDIIQRHAAKQVVNYGSSASSDSLEES